MDFTQIRRCNPSEEFRKKEAVGRGAGGWAGPGKGGVGREWAGPGGGWDVVGGTREGRVGDVGGRGLGRGRVRQPRPHRAARRFGAKRRGLFSRR